MAGLSTAQFRIKIDTLVESLESADWFECIDVVSQSWASMVLGPDDCYDVEPSRMLQ